VALKPITWHLNDFSGGIDTRDGVFSRNQNRFRLLNNYVLTNGKHIRRRWPYVDGGVTVPLPSQGIIPFANGLRTIQRAEDVAIVATTDVVGLGFDTPDNCTSEWELIDWAIYETSVLALIRHGYNSTDYPSIVRLHVLGNDAALLPTYVEDPYCPSNWKGGILVAPTVEAYVEAWNPRLVVNQGKVYLVGPDGNTHACKTGNPRAWNLKTIVNLTEVGQELAFVVPTSAAPLKLWTLSEAFEDFQVDDLAEKYRFTAYTLEWYDVATKVWTVMDEVKNTPSVDKTFRLRAVLNRQGGAKYEARIEVLWAGAPTILRFRMILAERSSTLSGDVATIAAAMVDISAGTHQITKEGVVSEYDTDLLAPTTLTDTKAWVALDDTGVKVGASIPTKSGVTILTSAPTGSQRWHNHIAQYLRSDGAGSYVKAPMILDDAWQAVRKIALALHAGANDACILPSAAHAGAGGGQVTALAILRQRLLIWYQRSSQLWQVGPLAADHALVDTGLIGTGTQPSPEPAPLESSVIIATPQGLRQFSIESLQEAYIREVGIGDQLRKLIPSGAIPTQHAATFWPLTGEYVTAVTLDGEDFVLGYDYAPASEVAGWSKWTMREFGVPVRKGMVAVDDRLYVRSGDVIRRFDASATAFRDVTDPNGAGNAYESRAVWAFNDFKSPSTTKQAMFIDVVQTGKGSFSLRYNPSDERWETAAIPITGSTLGRGKVPLMATGPALALVLTSTDETGHELEAVAIEFINRSR
jgi:hypothetical protein